MAANALPTLSSGVPSHGPFKIPYLRVWNSVITERDGAGALQNDRDRIAKVTADCDGILMYKYGLVVRWLCDVYGGVLGLTPRGISLRTVALIYLRWIPILGRIGCVLCVDYCLIVGWTIGFGRTEFIIIGYIMLTSITFDLANLIAR